MQIVRPRDTHKVILAEFQPSHVRLLCGSLSYAIYPAAQGANSESSQASIRMFQFLHARLSLIFQFLQNCAAFLEILRSGLGTKNWG